MRTANLSPAAQAVLNAVDFDVYSTYSPRYYAALALRALADQVAPAEVPEMHDCCHELIESVRREILTIATELKNANA